MGDPAGIKWRYRQFAETECKGYSDLYYRLALSVSDDDEVASFIADMPVPQPNLFLASIQRLTGPALMPGPGSELRTFVRQRGDDVRALMRARRTQTNEVGRCAVLLPALPPGPGLLGCALEVHGDRTRPAFASCPADRVATRSRCEADRPARR